MHFAIAALVLGLAACSRGIENKEAVRQAVVDHLSGKSGLDLNSMNVEVAAVSFRGNEADATIAFRPKGSADAGMQMSYTLERKGNRWEVKAKREGGSPHAKPGPEGAELPPGHPPVKSNEGSGKKQ